MGGVQIPPFFGLAVCARQRYNGGVKLYLVQHGLHNEETIDPEKNLSERGRQEVEKIAAFLKNAAVFADDVYQSGKARTVQTAEILAQAVQLSKKTIQKDGIGPNDQITDLRKEIDARNRELMVVGHMPFLGKLASALLTGYEQNDVVEFRQGCVVCLEKFGDKWQVKWMLVPDLF